MRFQFADDKHAEALVWNRQPTLNLLIYCMKMLNYQRNFAVYQFIEGNTRFLRFCFHILFNLNTKSTAVIVSAKSSGLCLGLSLKIASEQVFFLAKSLRQIALSFVVLQKYYARWRNRVAIFSQPPLPNEIELTSTGNFIELSQAENDYKKTFNHSEYF